MREITDPNWLTVVGILYATYGGIMLAGASTAGIGLTDASLIAGRQSVRSAFAIFLLVVAGATLAAAQFVSLPFDTFIVMDLLVLAFLALTFALVGEHWADLKSGSSSVLQIAHDGMSASIVEPDLDRTASTVRLRVTA